MDDSILLLVWAHVFCFFRSVMAGDVAPVVSVEGFAASLEPGVCAMSSKVRLTSRGARRT